MRSLIFDHSWQSVMTLANRIIEFSQTPALDVETEVVASVADFDSRTTCGLMLDHSRIDNIVPGGPAFNSRQLSRGDQILQVDGCDCTGASTDTIHDMLLGDDVPGSSLTVTVRKHSQDLRGSIQQVTLVRMPNEEIVDRRRLFELFTRLKDHAKQHEEYAVAKMIDETIELWKQMVLADVVHDETIEKNVRALQAGIKENMQDLFNQLSQLQQLSRQLALETAAVRDECVQIQVGLEMDKRKSEALQQEVAHDVAVAIGGNLDKIRVIGVEAASGAVVLGLDTDVCGEGRMVLDVVRHLAHQVEDPHSKLRCGTWTSKVTFVKVGHVPETIMLAFALAKKSQECEALNIRMLEEIDHLKLQCAQRLEDVKLRSGEQLEEISTRYEALKARLLDEKQSLEAQHTQQLQIVEANLQDQLDTNDVRCLKLAEEHEHRCVLLQSTIEAKEHLLDSIRTRDANFHTNRLKHAAVKVVRRWSHLRLMIPFQSWGSGMRERRRLMRAAIKVIKRWRMQVFSVAFGTWYGHTSECKRLKHIQNKALIRWKQKGTSVAFFSWHYKTQESLRLARAARKVLVRWTRMELAVAFSTWHHYERQNIRRDLAAEKIVRRWGYGKSSSAFFSWRHQVQRQAHLKSKARNILWRMMNRALTRGFERWRDHAVEERQMKAKALKVVQRLMNRALVEGFERWLHVCSELRVFQEKSYKVVLRLMNRRMASGFDRWIEHAVQKKAFKRKALKVVQRIRNLNLWVPFSFWCQSIQEVQYNKMAYKIVQSHFDSTGPRIRRSRSWCGRSIIESHATDPELDKFWRNMAQLYWAKVNSFVDTAAQYLQVHERNKQVREASSGGHLFDATYTGFQHDSVASTSKLVYAIGHYR